MTAEERTEKLILEIASLRRDVPLERQFTTTDFVRYLATHGIIVKAHVLGLTLQALVNHAHIRLSATEDGFRYLITDAGRGRLSVLQEAAEAEAAEPGIISCSLSVDCEISEDALDGWWETAAIGIKAQAFNAFYKPFKAEA